MGRNNGVKRHNKEAEGSSAKENDILLGVNEDHKLESILPFEQADGTMNQTESPLDLSICIIGINACEVLHNCLLSIQESGLSCSYRVIYVDNGSTDETRLMLTSTFPDVLTIWNGQNVGFARANNQAIRMTDSRVVLLLNPDTLVEPGSINLLMDFLNMHPTSGIVGPKVLNSDGSFQAHCKRGEARPWEVFCYFIGLAKLFPRSPVFSGYLQGFLDEDSPHDVPAVSGSCMLIRREVIDQMGGLDERYFAYQEDTDFCVSARKAGWKVSYFPEAKIIHLGGKGGAAAQPFRQIFVWHQSYFRYYQKQLAQDYFFLFNWFYYLLMAIKLLLSLFANLFRRNRHAGPTRG
jgi:GT2 family glycosyltransferase